MMMKTTKPSTRAFVKAVAHAAVKFLIVSCMVLSGRAANAITPGAALSFGVLGPLLMSSQQELDDFDTMLSEAKVIGAQAVSIDVWWGIVQPMSADDYEWSYYDKVFGMIRDHGLKIVPIMAFHKCGGGPGDACNIPVPAWVFNLAPDMKYESGRGHIHDDAVAVWATKEPAVLAAFRNFMQNFGTHFSGFSDDFTEINISLGPTGELRYPRSIRMNGHTRRRASSSSTVNALATTSGSGRSIVSAA